jgi:hypothetical protein
MQSILKIASRWSLAAALLVAPTAAALADDAATALTPSAAAATGTAAALAPALQSAAAPTSPSAASTANSSPAALTVTGTASAPVPDSSTAAADDSDQAPLPLPVIKENAASTESRSASVQPEAASPFKWSNFWLGFVGGALVGGTYGILFDTTGKAQTRNTETGLYGGIGALGFGTIAMLLGGTTPQAVAPPQTLLRRPMTGVQVAFRF